jgi:hypothetical protein
MKIQVEQFIRYNEQHVEKALISNFNLVSWHDDGSFFARIYTDHSYN